MNRAKLYKFHLQKPLFTKKQLYFSSKTPSKPIINLNVKQSRTKKEIKCALNATNSTIYGQRLNSKSTKNSSSGTKIKTYGYPKQDPLLTEDMYNIYTSLNSSSENHCANLKNLPKENFLSTSTASFSNNPDNEKGATVGNTISGTGTIKIPTDKIQSTGNLNTATSTLQTPSDTSTIQKDEIENNASYIATSTMHTPFDTDTIISLNNLPFDLSSTTINIEEVRKFPLLNPLKRNHKWNSGGIYSTSIFEGGYRKLPSVRKILQETMPSERKLILEKWEKNMIQSLGMEGFQNYRQGLLDKGKIFHKCIELELKNEPPSKEQLVGIEQQWKSIEHVMHSISNVRLAESRVIHPALQYQGCIDCVGMYKNMPVVFEFKNATSPKVTLTSTYDDPLQLVAYLGALNYDSSYDMPNINGAVLVVAYSTGLPAHVHVLSKVLCNKYWAQWCYRVAHFWKMQVETLSKEETL